MHHVWSLAQSQKVILNQPKTVHAWLYVVVQQYMMAKTICDGGVLLLDFCASRSLSKTNTTFKHKVVHQCGHVIWPPTREVVPLFKKGDRRVWYNYRGITPWESLLHSTGEENSDDSSNSDSGGTMWFSSRSGNTGPALDSLQGA